MPDSSSSILYSPEGVERRDTSHLSAGPSKSAAPPSTATPHSNHSSPTRTELETLLEKANKDMKIMHRELRDLRHRARTLELLVPSLEANYRNHHPSSDAIVAELKLFADRLACAERDRDDAQATIVYMTDSWGQLEEYLHVLDTHAQDAKRGLSNVFSKQINTVATLMPPWKLYPDRILTLDKFSGGLEARTYTQRAPSGTRESLFPLSRNSLHHHVSPKQPLPAPLPRVLPDILPPLSHSRDGIASRTHSPPRRNTHDSAEHQRASNSSQRISSSGHSPLPTRPTSTDRESRYHPYAHDRERSPYFRPREYESRTGRADESSKYYQFAEPMMSATQSPRKQSDGTTSESSTPPGQVRTCRSCGNPGRLRDGKCVEKWGPGPDGKGTVCDKCVPAIVNASTFHSLLSLRCRKKKVRLETREKLQAAASQLYPPDYSQYPYVGSVPPSGNGVDHGRTSQYSPNGYDRETDRRSLGMGLTIAGSGSSVTSAGSSSTSSTRTAVAPYPREEVGRYSEDEGGRWSRSRRDWVDKDERLGTLRPVRDTDSASPPPTQPDYDAYPTSSRVRPNSQSRPEEPLDSEMQSQSQSQSQMDVDQAAEDPEDIHMQSQSQSQSDDLSSSRDNKLVFDIDSGSESESEGSATPQPV